jgi:hypothetical protein
MRWTGGWPVLALVTGAVAAATTAAGLAVGAAVPGLGMFAAIFTGLVGTLVVLTVARLCRVRLPVPAPTVLVAGSVAASIAAIVIFLRREPAAAQYLPPAAAACLAVALVGCIWVAVASPKWLGTNRLAPHLGAAAGVAFAGWFLLAFRVDESEPPLPLVLVLGAVLALAPAGAFFVPAFAAGRVSRSFRSGLQAVVWALIVAMPLTYALWLPMGLDRHAIDGRSLDGEVVVPVGANLTDALIFCVGIFPVIGLMFGVLGAGLGARTVRSPAD